MRSDVVTGELVLEQGEFIPERPAFLGEAIGAIFKTGASSLVASAFQPGGVFGGGGFFPTSAPAPMPAPPAGSSLSGYTPTSAGSALRTAIPWATRMLKRYGPIIGQMIIDLYQQAKIDGLSENAARSHAMKGAGVRSGRRMNPTNVKALRRAIRRVRSFKRVTRKVNRLLPSPGRARTRVVYRRRRGDVNPFVAEDIADVYDEMEDLGYEPDSFRSDEENGD